VASESTKRRMQVKAASSRISAVDLFCGAGGLTHGLIRAGISVEAGVDTDEMARHAYEVNNPGAEFLNWDLSKKRSPSVEKLFQPDKFRLLAGCAPCQPFSRLTNGQGKHRSWDLLDYFGRLIRGIGPELVSMENVPELADRGRPVFERFLSVLKANDYWFDWRIVRCQEFGIPQTRRRLVLLASKLGPISIPEGRLRVSKQWKTVEEAIGNLPHLESGEECSEDNLHVASMLSDLNLRRIKATPHNGGTQKDWPEDLILDCHRKASGRSYYVVYGRMWWDKPSPTMTTLCTGLGNGRFGHPDQDRSITLREAAILQSFPRSYSFWPPEKRLNKKAVGRFIGNAVPPKLGQVLGATLLKHIAQY